MGNHYGRKVYSQNNEDGITLRILQIISENNIPLNKFFWEFGVEDGSECNTRILRNKWNGIIMDGGHEDHKINLFREIITWENIWNLIKKYKIPKDLGLLSIDTDYNDAYLAHRLLKKITPSIIIAEYNIDLGLKDMVVIHDPDHFWDYSKYYGCSALCLQRIYSDYGLISANSINLFFIHKDILRKLNFKQKPLKNIIGQFMKTKHPFKQDYFHRHWVSSKDVNERFVKKTIKYSKQINKELNKINLSKLQHYRQKKKFREFEDEVSKIKRNIYNKIKGDKPLIHTLISNRLSLRSKI